MVAITKPTTQTLAHNLPALPQVLVQLIDAINHEHSDLQHIAHIVRQDSALTARILTIANSSLYGHPRHCQTVERALMCLGLETVRIFVISFAMRQAFASLDEAHYSFMQRHWLRALTLAQAAHVLATLTRYPVPAQAYLAGLLTDAGELALLVNDPDDFLELQRSAGLDDHEQVSREVATFGISHCELGAELAIIWGLDSFVCDALRYHHEPAILISQAHHLTKIINLASDFSHPAGLTAHAREKAHALFGLNDDLVAELHQRLLADVEKMAHAMGIDQQVGKAQAALSQALADAAELQLYRAAAGGQSLDALATALLLSMGVDRHVVFTETSEPGHLQAYIDADTPSFELALNPAEGVLTRAVAENRQLDSESIPAQQLTLAEKQLLRYFARPVLLALPFVAEGRRGAVVAGVEPWQLPELRRKSAYWQRLLSALMSPPQAAAALDDAAGDSSRHALNALRRQIDEVLHEAGNPLSVISNYLEVLKARLSDVPDSHREIGILQEEIDRVGGILSRLQKPVSDPEKGLVDINRLLEDQVSIFARSMCNTRNILANLSLHPAPLLVSADASSVKQIVVNLLKNAIEAMSEGGTLSVQSQARVLMNGRLFHEVVIEDTGPGIAAARLTQLFEPAPSNKGGQHAGLGLSVVKRLLDGMGAQILCSSTAQGTQFRLLFAAGREAE